MAPPDRLETGPDIGSEAGSAKAELANSLQARRSCACQYKQQEIKDENRVIFNLKNSKLLLYVSENIL